MSLKFNTSVIILIILIINFSTAQQQQKSIENRFNKGDYVDKELNHFQKKKFQNKPNKVHYTCVFNVSFY